MTGGGTAGRLSMPARSGYGDGTIAVAPKVGIGVQIGTFLMMSSMMIVMS